MPQKKPLTLADAVEGFLDGLSLGGAEMVRAALARELAGAFAETPPYARGKLAAELRALLAELEGAEREAALPLLRGVDAGGD